MADHDTHDHTGVPGVGDAAVTDATITTTDVTTNNASTGKHGWLKKLSNVSTEYMSGTGAWSTPAGAGGLSVGQNVPYPTTFTGDVINGSDATPFADVDAFSTKAVENSRVLHLRTLGASQDDRVRVTLGTTKAAAFDFRTCFAANVPYWSTPFDSYFEVSLRTSANAVVAIARIYTTLLTANSTFFNTIRVGDTAVVGNGTNVQEMWPISQSITIQVKRDGSDNLTFFYGLGTAPLAMLQVLDGSHIPYTIVEAGTVARVEYSIHTPSGPGSTAALDAYIDYLSMA